MALELLIDGGFAPLYAFVNPVWSGSRSVEVISELLGEIRYLKTSISVPICCSCSIPIGKMYVFGDRNYIGQIFEGEKGFWIRLFDDFHEAVSVVDFSGAMSIRFLDVEEESLDSRSALM